MQLKSMPLEKITGSVYQPRQQDDRELTRLMRSIESNGLRVPIILQQKGGATSIVCGHRRIKALSGLLNQGLESLPAGEARINRGKVTLNALVLGPMEQNEAALTGFIENHERMDLSPYEQAVCYRTFVNDMGFSRADLARRVGVNRTTLDYLIAALSSRNLTARMIRSWKERKLNLAHVLGLFRLRDHRDRQQELYQMILSKRLTARDTEFWCNQLLVRPNLPLADREYDLLEKHMIGSPALKTYIDKKWLRLGRSSRGEQINLKFQSVDELREVLAKILVSLKGLDL